MKHCVPQSGTLEFAASPFDATSHTHLDGGHAGSPGLRKAAPAPHARVHPSRPSR